MYIYINAFLYTGKAEDEKIVPKISGASGNERARLPLALVLI